MMMMMMMMMLMWSNTNTNSVNAVTAILNCPSVSSYNPPRIFCTFCPYSPRFKQSLYNTTKLSLYKSSIMSL